MVVLDPSSAAAEVDEAWLAEEAGVTAAARVAAAMLVASEPAVTV